MLRKQQVSLRRDEKALATNPVRVDREEDLGRGLQEALIQFANTVSEEGIGENG